MNYVRDRNGNKYIIVQKHPDGSLYVRDVKTGREKWVKPGNKFYTKVKS